MAGYVIYTLWASMKEDISPWMIAAEDEGSWEGDPDRCESLFAVKRSAAELDGYLVREITLTVPWPSLDQAFQPPTIEAEAVATPPAGPSTEAVA